MAVTWAVVTNKGGVLKTSITTNLAGLLCKTKKVLIVDTDHQGNCAHTFGLDPSQVPFSLYDVLVLNEPIKKAIVNVYPNIDLLPSNRKMTMFSMHVIGNPQEFPLPFNLLRDALRPVMDQYDYILFDSPPNAELVQGNILTATEKVIIPFHPEAYSIRSLIDILDSIAEYKEQQNPALSILGVVATMVEPRTLMHKTVIEACEQFCSDQQINFFKTVIPRSIHFASSVGFHDLPATIAMPKQFVVTKYTNLLREVLQA